MRILYLGRSAGHTSARQRSSALERIGNDVICLDPYLAFASELDSRFRMAVHFRTGYRLLKGRLERWLQRILSETPMPDLIWVDGGELFGENCLKVLRAKGVPIVLYNLDDPTGRRDGHRFDLLREALPQYDLCVSVRRETEGEMRELGARKVLRVWRGYDEVIHAPIEKELISESFRSEVAFIGTWMPRENRDRFLIGLKERGVPVSIWGDAWQKAPGWRHLAENWRGPSLKGRDYAAGIGGAKVCLGILSRQNRDFHTQRSAEIPYAGGLFCGERTTEHSELYREGLEAAFWSNIDECASVCLELLEAQERRETIRIAGMERVRQLKIGNEDVCRHIQNVVSEGLIAV